MIKKHEENILKKHFPYLRPCNGFAVLRRVRNCRVWL